MPTRKNACLHILAEENALHFRFVVFDLNLLASMSGDEEGFVRFSSQNLPTDAEIDTLTINKRSSFGFKRMRVQLWVQKEQQKGVS